MLEDGELAVTYCTNDVDFWTMAGDTNLYFPRFVHLSVVRHP